MMMWNVGWVSEFQRWGGPGEFGWGVAEYLLPTRRPQSRPQSGCHSPLSGAPHCRFHQCMPGSRSFFGNSSSQYFLKNPWMKHSTYSTLASSKQQHSFSPNWCTCFPIVYMRGVTGESESGRSITQRKLGCRLYTHHSAERRNQMAHSASPPQPAMCLWLCSRRITKRVSWGSKPPSHPRQRRCEVSD